MTAPAFILYSIFLVIPIGMAIYFAFHSWSGIRGTPLIFVGLRNFVNTFKNQLFTTSMKNLVQLVFFSVLFHTPIALLMAVGINSRIKGKRFFKFIYFVPTVFPLTAIGLLWFFIFMPNGSLNTILQNVGLGWLAQGWLINPATAMPTIIFVNIWAGVGYYMIILLAGLKGIPDDVYEAALIDGASPKQIFFKITLPILRPVIQLCIMLDIIGTVKVFDLIFVMTGGGPNGLTNVPTTLVYYEAFRYDNYGMASAIGVVLLVLTVTATLLSQFIPKWIARRSVK
ncbi:sugar ABC transporter permease [Schleiferilactobacillus harbinensis]|nr:sugar ABC transporter permease [Schleiferilactobacillus harbinensis]